LTENYKNLQIKIKELHANQLKMKPFLDFLKH